MDGGVDLTDKKTDEKLNWSIAVVIIIGTFMAILDGTIVNVTLPKMMAVFGVSPSQIQWVATVYMLTLGVVMPVSGYLGDRYGYKRMYIFALGMFTFGSVLCGASWNLSSMVVARVIQGIGGGIMQPLGMAIMYQNYPRSRMGMVLGVWGISAMVAPAVGPTLGGYLVDYASWRLIFYINLPVGILNLFLAALILRETQKIAGKSFDVVGIAASTVGFLCLLLALSQGNDHGWGSPYIVSLLAIAFTSLTILVVNELRHPEPVLDLRLFRNFIFTLSVIIGSIISIGMFGVIFLFPMFLQNVLGQTAMQTGLIMFPAALASGLVMPVSGRIFDKYGARGIVVAGLTIVTFTTYMMKGFNALTPFSVMIGWLVLRGFGMGFSFMPVNTAGMNTVPPPLVGRASALSNVIRQVASAFGIAMFATIMQHRQVIHYHNLAQNLNLKGDEGTALMTGVSHLAMSLGLSPAAAQGLGIGVVSQQVVKLSMVQAIGDCFIVSAGMCLLATLCSLMLGGSRRQQQEPVVTSRSPVVEM